MEADNQLIVTMSNQPVSSAHPISASTDVMRIPDGLDLTQPVTARLWVPVPPVITLLGHLDRSANRNL